LGPPKRQALLALLAVRAPEPVSVAEAVDVLWETEPPDSAVNVVHRHVGGLRRLLEPGLPTKATGRFLTRTAGGYLLAVDADSSDLARFRTLRRRAHEVPHDARTAPGEPDPHAGGLRPSADLVRARLLADALRLWRGPVAEGCPPHVQDHPAFTSVRHELVAAAKEAADATPWHDPADPALAEEVLAALRRAAADGHRLDEALQARTVIALAATGRAAEALRLFESVRRELAEELGMDASPELCAAHERVLRGGWAATVRPPSGVAPRRVTVPVKPAQLPADLPSFVGREAELARTRALLEGHCPQDPYDRGDTEGPGGQDGPRGPFGPEDGRTVVTGAISGMAGVGKTTLAIRLAHTLAGRFPDGHLYVNLRGFHPALDPLSPSEAMRHLVEGLGVPPQQLPEGTEALTALYRSLFADRRMLVLLDNARDSEQVRPLLPAASGCLAIITSRHRLDGLVVTDDVRFIPLDLLTRAEGVQLLVRRLGDRRVAAEPEAAADIVDLCGRLPLALAIVGARAVAHPSFPLASIAAELREGQGNLDVFTSRDARADVRSVFSWSYRALSPAAARLFRLLSLHAAPDIGVPAAASLAALPPRETRIRLGELVEHHLLFEVAPGRFGAHELLRAYAAELAADEESEPARADALRRVLGHYLHTAHAADSLLAPYRERVAVPLAPAGVVQRPFDGQPEAGDWFAQERPVLVAMVEQAARLPGADGGAAWRLASLLEIFLDRHGRWQEQQSMQTTALNAARAAGDVHGEAHALRALGFAAGRLGAHAEARRQLREAVELFGRLGDRGGQGRSLRYLAFVANAERDHEAALAHYREAAVHYETTGHAGSQAALHNEIGWTHLLMGDGETALVHCEKAVAMHAARGDLAGEAACWDSVGCAQHRLGRNQEALVSYGRAVDLYQRVGDHSLEADTLVHAGDAHRARADLVRAREMWSRALRLYERLDHPDAAVARAKLASVSGAEPKRVAAAGSGSVSVSG
jgi:tetratricopeptide (TPR) repeat protein